MNDYDDMELTQEEKKGILLNLISVMVADCRIDPAEIQFLEKIRQKLDISRQELNEIFRDLGAAVRFVPKDPQDRIIQLLEMVSMMVVDGHIDEREMEVCNMAAQRFGFDSSVIDTLVESIDQGLEREQITEILQTLV